MRTGNSDIHLVITAGISYQGRVEPAPMRFRNQGEELVYCSPHESVRDQAGLLKAASDIPVELLYPMSGLEIEEPVLQPGRIGVLLGQGQTAQVLRNLCLMVYRDSPADWEKIVRLMERLFHLKLGSPVENVRGAIDLSYEQPGVREPLTLSAAGRSFQQMLLIFAYLHAHKRSVMLVDEPDAHLEILRQRQIFVLLRQVASANGSQVIMVTHSEVILDAALDNNLTLLLEGRADNLAKKTDIRESLKLFGTAHYVRARQKGYVLYLEGDTDEENLKALAVKADHPAVRVWDEAPNVFFVQNVYSQPSIESEIERVEGGFGIAPKDHFNGLRKLLPGLRGLALLDNEGRNPPDFVDASLQVRHWKRYELENYFVTPELLLRYAAHANRELDLFAMPDELTRSVLDEAILERIFGGDESDFRIYSESPAEARRLIWDAKTQTIKLSTFAEEFFRRLGSRTAFEMLLTKGELHHLIPFVAAESIPREVIEKLDLLEELFRQAAAIVDA